MSKAAIFKEPFLHKYILLWICKRTYRNGLYLPSTRSLEAFGPGAAAHMSLHQTDNFKEPLNI